MSGAVIRHWEATVNRADIGPWLETFRARAFPHMRAVPGFRGISILAGRDADPCRVRVLTRWDDMDAVRRYAGADAVKTVMSDFMAKFFTDYDAEATFHDEVLLEGGT